MSECQNEQIHIWNTHWIVIRKYITMISTLISDGCCDKGTSVRMTEEIIESIVNL